MTKREIVKAVKAVAPNVSIKWNADTREWRISRNDIPAERREAIAYYTNDDQDALSTGKAMGAWTMEK